MSGSFVLIAVVATVIALVVVLAPLRSKPQTAPAEKGPAPVSEYESTLVALRDLDFDHELGVVAEDDYARLREELVTRAAQTMPRKKPHGKSSAKGAKKRSARGKKGGTGGKKAAAPVAAGHGECPECGRPHQPDHVFCGKCGARLSAA